MRQSVIAKMSFAETVFPCGEQWAGGLFKTPRGAYLSVIGERSSTMAKLITLLMAVSLVVVAAAPAVYAYAALA